MLSDDDILNLHTANRSAYEQGRSPDYPTKYLTEADLPTEAKWDDIPPNINVITEQPLQLDLDSWLYCSDLHIPFHNREYIRKLLLVAENRGIRNLIIGGDFYNFSKFSKHPATTAVEDANHTLALGGDLLVRLAQTFETIYLLPGNHDLWLSKKLDTMFSFENIIWAGIRGNVRKEQIVVTDYDYIFVGPPETGWVVGHPRYFSTIPAKGGAEVAMLQHRNVIGAHNHIQGLMKSKCGRYLSIDPGHMCEPTLTPYKMQSDGLSKYPAWTAGFVLIQDNVPTIMAEGLVRWGDYGLTNV